MGKRIISQARGHGSLTYRVRSNAYIYKLAYPPIVTKGIIVVSKLVNSPAHSAPLAKFMVNDKPYYVPAGQGLYEGQEIKISNENPEIENGNIIALKDIPMGTRIFNVEIRPGDGGKMVRTSGGFATILKKDDKQRIVILMKNKKEVSLNPDCRVTIGIVAGQGRTNKPLVKAGKQFHRMKARNKKWHSTSAVKVNAVDHPFGGGRGKRIKSKIAKRNAPPGRRVGHISPKRTGRKSGGK